MQFYADKRVFITGHTGFKGSWLSLWLAQAGARVIGYSRPPEETPDSLFTLTSLAGRMTSHYGDVGNFSELSHVLKEARPDVVFHMAAQSLVLPSYESPVETFATNVMGTVHVLEAVRKAGGVKAVVNVTTDKCYENNETAIAFREDDKLGGYDPYSSSKAAAEIVSAGYRHSFLTSEHIPMATVRAGNVIGGGDFSRHRLIPDIIRAAQSKVPVNLRHPESIRPWQYVLDVLHGYLLVGKALYEQGESYAQAYNFGPDESNVTVGVVADQLVKAMQNPVTITHGKTDTSHEAHLLKLNNIKAKTVLGWRPRLSTHDAIETTAKWYGHYLAHPQSITEFTLEQLTAYRTGIPA